MWRGSPAFLPEEGCDDFVRMFDALYVIDEAAGQAHLEARYGAALVEAASRGELLPEGLGVTAEDVTAGVVAAAEEGAGVGLGKPGSAAAAAQPPQRVPPFVSYASHPRDAPLFVSHAG